MGTENSGLGESEGSGTGGSIIIIIVIIESGVYNTSEGNISDEEAAITKAAASEADHDASSIGDSSRASAAAQAAS